MTVLHDIERELRRFFEDVRVYVLNHASEIPVRTRDIWRVERENGERKISSKLLSLPDYAGFLFKRQSDVTAFGSFAHVRDSVQSDSKISGAFLGQSHGDVISVALFQYFLPLADELLRAFDEGQEWDAGLNARLKLLDDFLQRDTYTVQFFAPLLNFDSSATEVELSDGIRVCPIPDDKLEMYMNTANTFSGATMSYQILQLRFQLQLVIETPRVSPYLPPVSNPHFTTTCGKLLKAFRLISPGAIGIAFTGSESRGPLGPAGVAMVQPNFGPLFGDAYEFREADAPKIVELYSKLEALEKDPRCALAMRRFMGSYEKPFEGDRLIDYWIALEALLMPEQDTGELSYRISLRGASFIAETTGRKKVFDAFRKSYAARSRFVHGNPTKVASDVVSDTEVYLRTVLRKCLDVGKPPTRDRLDSRVLGGIQGQN
jgi:hypothetical protein